MKVREKVSLYDAVKFDPKQPLPDGVTEVTSKSGRGNYNLRTKTGLVKIKPGMWIVTGPKTQKLMDDKTFRELYEEV